METTYPLTVCTAESLFSKHLYAQTVAKFIRYLSLSTTGYLLYGPLSVCVGCEWRTCNSSAWGCNVCVSLPMRQSVSCTRHFFKACTHVSNVGTIFALCVCCLPTLLASLVGSVLECEFTFNKAGIPLPLQPGLFTTL